MLGANVIWGLMSPFSKYVILGGIVSALSITSLRMIGAALLFWIASLFSKKEHVPLPDLVRLFFAGMIGVLINQTCFMLGVGFTSPGNASIITTTMPLWVMILAAFILKEPITTKKVGGIVCGAAGAVLLILGSPKGLTGDNPLLGNLLVLTAQFSYALYLCLYKRFITKYTLVTLMKWMFTFAALVNLVYSLPTLISIHWAELRPLDFCSLAFTVVFGTFVAYILIMIGQKTLRPTVVGMYNYFQPIVSCLVAIAMGLDYFNLQKGAAIILIFCGVWLVTRSKSRADMDKEHATADSPHN